MTDLLQFARQATSVQELIQVATTTQIEDPAQMTLLIELCLNKPTFDTFLLWIVEQPAFSSIAQDVCTDYFESLLSFQFELVYKVIQKCPVWTNPHVVGCILFHLISNQLCSAQQLNSILPFFDGIKLSDTFVSSILKSSGSSELVHAFVQSSLFHYTPTLLLLAACQRKSADLLDYSLRQSLLTPPDVEFFCLQDSLGQFSSHFFDLDILFFSNFLDICRSGSSGVLNLLLPLYASHLLHSNIRHIVLSNAVALAIQHSNVEIANIVHQAFAPFLNNIQITFSSTINKLRSFINRTIPAHLDQFERLDKQSSIFNLEIIKFVSNETISNEIISNESSQVVQCDLFFHPLMPLEFVKMNPSVFEWMLAHSFAISTDHLFAHLKNACFQMNAPFVSWIFSYCSKHDIRFTHKEIVQCFNKLCHSHIKSRKDANESEFVLLFRFFCAQYPFLTGEFKDEWIENTVCAFRTLAEIQEIETIFPLTWTLKCLSTAIQNAEDEKITYIRSKCPPVSPQFIIDYLQRIPVTTRSLSALFSLIPLDLLVQDDVEYANPLKRWLQTQTLHHELLYNIVRKLSKTRFTSVYLHALFDCELIHEIALFLRQFPELSIFLCSISIGDLLSQQIIQVEWNLDESTNVCTICYDSSNPLFSLCQHPYCKECIKRIKTKCVVCSKHFGLDHFFKKIM